MIATGAPVAALLASPAADGAHGGFSTFLLALVATIFATSVLGYAAQRMRQPAVLGELLAGVLLGASVLGVLNPSDPAVAAFAQIGVLLLLFQVGMQTDLKALTRVGTAAGAVALVGVAIPFAGGYVAARAFGVANMPALVCAAALTATSVGISARVLGDLGMLDTRDGQVVLGAAVLDDIVGLVILSVVVGLVDGAAFSVVGVARTAVVAIAFVVAALFVGRQALPPLLGVVGRLDSASALGLVGLTIAFLLAWLADRTGSAMIIGAFAAGLVLHPTQHRHQIEAKVRTLGQLFIPVFFASVGAAVDLRALLDRQSLLVGAALLVIGIAGKVAAGWAPWWYRGDKLMIGVAMVPRGEVGLIFAQMGLTAAAITQGQFGAIMLMVLGTTLVTPPWLTAVVRRRRPEAIAAPPTS